MTPTNVLLPFMVPNTKSLRAAVANIIRDIQLANAETDQDTADRLGVSVGTIRNARNEQADLGALTIAKIGAIYGEEAVEPYHALYRAERSDTAAPVGPLANAIAALSMGDNHKARLAALPALKEAAAALDGCIANIERLRLVS